MDFLFQDYLYFLLLIPLLLILYYLSYKYAEHVKFQFISPSLLSKMGIKNTINRIGLLSYSLLLGSIIFMIFALARPLGDFLSIEQEMQGSELVVCFDVSTSMLTRDVKPNRLEHGKETLRRIVRELRGDRLGIVIFSEYSSVYCPITSDYNAILSFIDGIDYDFLTGGTKLADALEIALNVLERNKEVGPAGKGLSLIHISEPTRPY